jgi:glycosyltransferase involved in cell wall biosynthesis
VATGPNAWLQRLVPDLTRNYGLNVQTLFIYSGIAVDCPTLSFFKAQGLPTSTINRDELPYVADQVKALLHIVKKEAIQVVVANLVIPAFYATFYLRQAGIPVIGVMHSNDLFYEGVITKFIHGDIQRQLSHCVSVSKYIHKICQNNPTTSQLIVIPCGTPMPQSKASWTNHSVLKVMYAGRIVEEQKQILKLASAFIRAAEMESRLKFSIYGDGEQSAQLESMLNEQKEHNVTYLGAVAPDMILKCFEQHQVFSLMSDYEGMPVALMEAMACGVVPVCLAERSGVNEIIEHGVNGFIVKDRDADYQKHLQMLLDDPDLWQKLSNNAVKTIQERYSSATTHRQWYELLQSLSGQQIGSIKIPRRIQLEGDLLYYGDNRKPSTKEIIFSKVKDAWLNIRLFLRPRARLRALLNK